MVEYLTKLWAVFLIAFAPLTEIYIAVPTGVAMHLDVVSVVIVSVVGNFAPVLLIHFCYDQLMRIRWLARWLHCMASPKIKTRLESAGFWFYLVMTPILGTWAIGATVKVLQMSPRRFLLPVFLSVVFYGVLLAVLSKLGMAVVD